MTSRANRGVAARTGLFVGLLSILCFSGVATAADRPTVVRLLDAPAVIDVATAQLLTAELADARAAGARIVVRVEADRQDTMTPDALKVLAGSARAGDLVVLVTGQARDSAGQGAALLYGIAPSHLSAPAATLPPITDVAARATVKSLEGCNDTCAQLAQNGGVLRDAAVVQSSAELLAVLGAQAGTPTLWGRLTPNEEGLQDWFASEPQVVIPPTPTPAPKEPGGGFPLWPLALALILIGAAGVLLRRRAAAIQRPDPEPQPPSPPVPPRRHGKPPARPPRAPAGQRIEATLRTVLQPEGYAEIDGCMRRVRWDARAGEPPGPGAVVQLVKGADDRVLAVASSAPARAGRKQLERGRDDTGRTHR